MEFWQFHPTGVAGAGVLITEGVRGEGSIAQLRWPALYGALRTYRERFGFSRCGFACNGNGNP